MTFIPAGDNYFQVFPFRKGTLKKFPKIHAEFFDEAKSFSINDVFLNKMKKVLHPKFCPKTKNFLEPIRIKNSDSLGLFLLLGFLMSFIFFCLEISPKVEKLRKKFSEYFLGKKTKILKVFY